MWRFLRKGYRLTRDFLGYFHRGWQVRLTIAYAKSFASSFILHLNQFRHTLYTKGIEFQTIREPKIKKLRETANGLHALLPKDERYTYSILLIVENPSDSFLRTSLLAACDQSPPICEVLVALKKPLSASLEKVLCETKGKYPTKIQIFDHSKQAEKDRTFHQLAESAKGNFLLLMGAEDWIRPDLLFRYEQTLRTMANPENCVLYCDVNQLNEIDAFVPSSEYCQPTELNFPYFFKHTRTKGLLIPRVLWHKIEAPFFYEGAEEEDLLLRLDLAGAQFHRVPFSLYSVRCVPSEKLTKSIKSLQHVLESYSQKKGLQWKWEPGYLQTSLRAIPPLPQINGIQVIIPFKDQKELTLKCVQSLLKQHDVPFKITAVDNRSVDQSIAEAIQTVGGEVIRVDEPFNYSRLNNIAVQNTKLAADCDVILFLNNDVELEAGALSEMLRWVNQTSIGLVGSRLHYPDGRLQHGGVHLHDRRKKDMEWEHIEKFRSFDAMQESKTLEVFDAVTAACAMMKRKTFLEVGGFDEIWYPIAYSDTNLAIKLKAIGLKCFYTPYAAGIHHESVSRKTAIEDFENSWWLHHLLQDHKQ